jgi:AspT/YidE/YbjL antiporter-like protein
VLVAALVFGHFRLSVPREVMDFGLILFVYAVGLTAGPSFFRTFRRGGMRFVVLALVIVGSGAILTALMAVLLKLSPALAAGLYTGALTCTPALASVLDSLHRLSPDIAPLASVGYGIAYPFSMISMVLLIQFLPHLLKRPIKTEEQEWLTEKEIETPGLLAQQFRITNPNCEGRTVAEVNPRRLAQVNLSRVKHGERVFAATPETILHLGDVVMAVGPADELDKMTLLLGEQTDERMDVNAEVLSVDVEVMDESLTGRTLAQMRVWEQFTVVITRIRRQGLEIVPHGRVTLEMGDGIRVVGEKSAVEAFVQRAQGSPRRAGETSMTAYLVGLLIGVLLVCSHTARSGCDNEAGHGGRSLSDQFADRSLWEDRPAATLRSACREKPDARTRPDAFSRRRRDERRRASGGGDQRPGLGFVVGGRGHHHIFRPGWAGRNDKNLQTEPALRHGRTDRCHDQPARAGFRQQPDRNRPAFHCLCQHLPRGSDLQDFISQALGEILGRLFVNSCVPVERPFMMIRYTGSRWAGRPYG